MDIDTNESWMTANWRPLAAMVYLSICMLDFFFMPIYYELHRYTYTPERLVQIASVFKDGATQIETIRVLQEEENWHPLTLAESGLFHIAFGAILGVASWSSGQEKLAKIKNDGHGIVPDAPDA